MHVRAAAGNVDGSCSQTISMAIAKTFEATAVICKMELSCFDRLQCTYQVFSFLSSAIVAAKNIDTAVFQCDIDDGDGDDGDDGGYGGDDGDGDSGDDGGGDGDGDGSSDQAPPDLTPEQVAQLYPNGTPPPSSRRLDTALRGQPRRARIVFSRPVLPPSAHGLE